MTGVQTCALPISDAYGLPVLVSTHPRTRKRLETQDPSLTAPLVFHAPFGFHDYVHLQQHARLVLSDSGTISEESAILQFPAVSLRDAIERPEAIDTGVTITTGVGTDSVLDAVAVTLSQCAVEGVGAAPWEYEIADASRRAVNFILSTVRTHHQRAGIRVVPGVERP